MPTMTTDGADQGMDSSQTAVDVAAASAAADDAAISSTGPRERLVSTHQVRALRRLHRQLAQIMIDRLRERLAEAPPSD